LRDKTQLFVVGKRERSGQAGVCASDLTFSLIEITMTIARERNPDDPVEPDAIRRL
jgi:hypothetical protein